MSRLNGWLLAPAERLPPGTSDREAAMLHVGRFLSLAIGVNMMLVAGAVALRVPTSPFMAWAGLELLFGGTRLAIVVRGRQPGRLLSVGVALGSAASVGFGTFLCLTSQQWAVSTVGCLSAAAMIGGLCLRFHAERKLAAAILLLGLGPCVVTALLAGEPILLLVVLQVPLYAAAMVTAAIQVNRSTARAVVAEQDNDRRAHHDSLTGLLNRAGLAREMARRAKANDRFALLYLDLHRFKAVNDSLGHQAGDELLKAVADRLRLAGRPDDTIARIGGDEFVILAAVPDPASAKAAGQRIVEAISEEGYYFRKEAAFIGASVGIALCPEHGRELGTLLGEADAALYQAKFSDEARCVIARTGIQRGPVDDRKPVSLAAAQARTLRGKAA